MRVVIQQKQVRFPNIHYFAAWKGFQELGFESVLAETEEIPGYEVSPDSIAAGEIPVMLAAFQRREFDTNSFGIFRLDWIALPRVGSGRPLWVKQGHSLRQASQCL